MALKYSKIFTVTGGTSHGPITILVDVIKPIGGEDLIGIETLEGEYGSREELEDALKYAIKGWEKGYTRDKGEEKMWSLITLILPDARQLVDTLNEALAAPGEG